MMAAETREVYFCAGLQGLFYALFFLFFFSFFFFTIHYIPSLVTFWQEFLMCSSLIVARSGPRSPPVISAQNYFIVRLKLTLMEWSYPSLQKEERKIKITHNSTAGETPKEKLMEWKGSIFNWNTSQSDINKRRYVKIQSNQGAVNTLTNHLKPWRGFRSYLRTLQTLFHCWGPLHFWSLWSRNSARANQRLAAGAT